MNRLVLFLMAGMVARAADGYVEVPGARLHYADSGGTGAAVVFLHAATGTTSSWEKQTAAVTGAGYRLVAFDRRGWGKTTVEPGAAPGNAVDDLMAITAHLGIGQFHLVGTAAGGIVALDFALAHPERLRSIVVANSVAGMQDAAFQQMLRRLRPAKFDEIPAEFRELGPAYRAENEAGTAAWIALEKTARVAGIAAQPPKNRPTLAMLADVTVPTLVIAGGADLYAPPPVLKQVADKMPQARFVVFERVGHSAYWEEAEAFNRALLEFWRGK